MECIGASSQRTQHLHVRFVTNDLPKVQVYKDSNHKPEMAIAITDFEALCGFVPHQELKDALQSVPELRELIGDVSCFSLLSLAHDFLRIFMYLLFTFSSANTHSSSDTMAAMVRVPGKVLRRSACAASQA